jgi:uncharacterized protein with beta-barrel porin domain
MQNATRFTPSGAGLQGMGMEYTTHGARSSRARSVWLRVVLALGLLFGMGTAAAQCALTGQVGAPYSQSFNVTGGTAPYSWSISAGALPAGVALTSSGATALISGTPRAGGNFAFTISVAHATGGGSLACTLAMSPPSIAINPAALTSGTWGVPYSASITASAGTAPYTFAVTSGALPAGVLLAANGTLSGTPTTVGTFNFTVTASDSSTGTGPYSASHAYTLSVAPPTIDVTPSNVPTGTVGQPYSVTFTGTGGTGPYSFGLMSGTLPPGLTLSSNGEISGTPTAGGTFDFDVIVVDANDFTGSRHYTLGVAPPTMSIAPATLANATAGAAYTQSIVASGGTAPYSYAISAGTLPAGLTLSSTGALSGTPTVSGSFNFTVTATDSSTGFGPYTAPQSYTLVVDAPTITVAPTTLPNGVAGSAFSQSLSASGGVAPYTWSLSSGSLPTGMSFSSGGALSGTPTVAGSFNFTVRATDANGFDGDQAYTLAISAPTITVTPSTLPAGVGGSAYSQSLSASGGVAPYTWSLAGGALPAGLTLSSSGALSGTPTVAGSFNVTVRATDANGFGVDQAYTLAISAPTIALTPTSLPAATAATAYSQSLSANGGVASYTYALSAGALPAGIALSASGTVAGTPTVVGNFNFTIRATDANGFTGEQAYTLAIAALVPVAGNDSAHTTATQSVTVDVTANDTGGPFTGATVLSVTPVNAGTATFAHAGAAWLLTFSPAADFSGTASVRYTVSNAYATSAAATLDVIVEARPDPSRDPDVLGLLSAQANATRGFARAQIQNVQQRLESLHGGADGNGWHNNLSLASATRCERNTFDRTATACPQLQDANSATDAPAQPSAAPVGLWTAGSFGSGERDFRFGRSALDFETSGISVGADYRISGSFVLGTALGYGRDRTNVGIRETRADGESYSAMAYASWSPSAATFLDAVFGYQRLSFDTRRTVATNGATVTGSRDGTQWFGSLATGYEYRNGGTLVAPYGRVDLGKAQLDPYSERGDATYALRYGRQDVDTGTASVGLRIEQQFRQEWGMFTPLFRVEHQHDFQGQGDTTLQYADLPAGPFYRAFGDTFDRSRWLLGLGTGFTFSDALNLKFDYLYMGDGSNEDQSLRVILQGRF